LGGGEKERPPPTKPLKKGGIRLLSTTEKKKKKRREKGINSQSLFSFQEFLKKREKKRCKKNAISKTIGNRKKKGEKGRGKFRLLRVAFLVKRKKKKKKTLEKART